MLRVNSSTLFTDKDKILKRWEEHFDNVLNPTCPSTIAAIAQLPQADTNMILVQPISEEEVKIKHNSLLNGKASGADAIPRS